MSTAVRALPDGFKIRTDLYQVMPPLNTTDLAKLRDSIAREGVQIPVIIREEDGGIIDGHHRWEIAAELSMTGDVVLDFRSYATDELARSAAYDINDARRHMTIAERNEIARRLIDSGATQKETAGVLGVSQQAIAAGIAEKTSLPEPGKEVLPIEDVLAKRPAVRGIRRTKNAAESAALTVRIVELHKSGMSAKAVADLLGIHPTAVDKRLRKHRAPKPVELPKWERAAELAATSTTSEEIATALGVHIGTVKKWAKLHGFTVPADAAVANTQRRINSTEVLANSVEIFAHTTDGLGLIKFESVNPDRAEEWLCSLQETQSAIRTLIKQIKSLTKEQNHG